MQLSWAGEHAAAAAVLERQMALAEADAASDSWPAAGRVTLRSAEPLDAPEINFRYFDDDPSVPAAVYQDDLTSVVNGIKMVRKLSKQGSFITSIEREIAPGLDAAPEGDDAALEKFVRENAWGHHASCSVPINDSRWVLPSARRAPPQLATPSTSPRLIMLVEYGM